MAMKLEYLILILLTIGFFTEEKKDYLEEKRRQKAIRDLKVKDKVLTKSGIIGEVVEIDGEKCIIVTGSFEKYSYIQIEKSAIKAIIEA